MRFQKKKWDCDDEIQRKIPRKIDQKPATIPAIGDDKKYVIFSCDFFSANRTGSNVTTVESEMIFPKI